MLPIPLYLNRLLHHLLKYRDGIHQIELSSGNFSPIQIHVIKCGIKGGYVAFCIALQHMGIYKDIFCTNMPILSNGRCRCA